MIGANLAQVHYKIKKIIICNYCIALCVNVTKMTEATNTYKFFMCNEGCTALASDPLKNCLYDGTCQSMPGETSESGMIL